MVRAQPPAEDTGLRDARRARLRAARSVVAGAAAFLGDRGRRADCRADPRRLDVYLGEMVFGSDETIVQDIIGAISRGWILDPELRSELLAVIDEVVRADRVLVAVAIDDAIVAVADAEKIAEAQEMLEEGDALVKEAAVWEQLDKKSALLREAINQYRDAWVVAADLTQ